MASSLSLGGTLVMESEEYEALRTLVGPKQLSTADKDRLALKALSDARMEKWPNTLVAQRRRKDEERAASEAKEEAENKKGANAALLRRLAAGGRQVSVVSRQLAAWESTRSR